MTVQRFKLKQVQPNPWQVRLEEDSEHIGKLALSILMDGLLQVPVGRRKGAGVELAFGMSRLAAFRLLAGGTIQVDGAPGRRMTRQAAAGFASLPVDVRKLDDRRMFELAVVENQDRKDLSPIEQALAMQRGMVEFGMKRTAVATLFGVQPGSVSNKISLLRLPDDIRQMVHDGRMPERSARMFVHLAALDPARASRAAAEVVAADDADPGYVEDTLAGEMRQAGKELANPWDLGRVGGRWFKVDERMPGPLTVASAQAADALRGLAADGKVTYASAADAVELVTTAKAAREILALLEGGQDPATVAELHGWPAEAVDRVEHLRNPPACTACDFHSVIGGTHFCGLPVCLAVKKGATKGAALERVKRKKAVRGIPVYDKADGEHTAYPGGSTYYGYGKRQDAIKEIFAAAVAEKHPDLRLRMAAASYDRYPATEDPFVEVVAVGQLAEKVKKLQPKETGGFDNAKYEEKRRKEQENDAVSHRVVEAAAPLLASVFGAVKGNAVQVLVYMLDSDSPVRVTPDGRAVWEPWIEVSLDDFGAEGMELWPGWAQWDAHRRDLECQRYLGWKLADMAGWESFGQKPARTVELVGEIAGKLGIKLAPGWADEALAGETEPVVAEVKEASDESV